MGPNARPAVRDCRLDDYIVDLANTRTLFAVLVNGKRMSVSFQLTSWHNIRTQYLASVAGYRIGIYRIGNRTGSIVENIDKSLVHMPCRLHDVVWVRRKVSHRT